MLKLKDFYVTITNFDFEPSLIKLDDNIKLLKNNFEYYALLSMMNENVIYKHFDNNNEISFIKNNNLIYMLLKIVNNNINCLNKNYVKCLMNYSKNNFENLNFISEDYMIFNIFEQCVFIDQDDIIYTFIHMIINNDKFINDYILNNIEKNRFYELMIKNDLKIPKNMRPINTIAITHSYTPAMCYIKYLRKEPPFWMRHDPAFSLTFTQGKYRKPITIQYVWKQQTGLKPLKWMCDIDEYNIMIMSHNKKNIEYTKNILAVNNNHEHCYLLQLLNEKNNNINIYKIGRSDTILTRMKTKEYTNARIILIMQVSDSKSCEKDIIQFFTNKYELIKTSIKTNKGNEYFKGDIIEMRNDFIDICNKYFN